MNKRLVAVAPLCSILLCTSAQATSDKPRSIAACTAALGKKGIKADRLSAVSTEVRANGCCARVTGTVNSARNPGANFVCRTRDNAVYSLRIRREAKRP